MARSNTANGGQTYFDLGIQVVSADTTQYVLRAVVYLTSPNVVDSVNDLTVSGGGWSRSGALALNGVYSAAPVWYQDIAINRAYGANQTVTVSATWSGVEYWGTTLSASESYVVPARPYELPAAPTGIAVARTSDTSHTVTWTNNPSTAAPYESIEVLRSTNGLPWASIATLPGGASSYTDTTTVGDRAFSWLVKARNSSGFADAGSGTVYTTPAAPGTPTAEKIGTNIVLSFSNTASYDEGVRVYESQGGGAFTLLATVAGADLTSWTHVSPDASVTHAYKVSTYRGTLESAQSAASNTVQLLAAPNAPTNLGPSVVRDATEDVTLTWRHNPVDTTAQTAFQLRHRPVGSSTWTTVTVTSASSSWVMPGGTYANPVAVEWQVATKGQHADYSPWSATATLPSSARPTATIAAPGAVVDRSTVTVEWAYYDAEGKAQASWQVDLLNATGAVVESTAGAGAAAAVTLGTRVPDGSSWTVRVTVQDADGMWSLPDTAAFTVAYALPPTPVVSGVWDAAAGSVTVTVTVADPGDGEVAADHVDLYRANNNGPWTLIATGLPINTTVTDWAPATVGTVAYRADAISTLPSSATSSPLTVTVGGTEAVFVSGGPGMAHVCRTGSAPEVSEQGGRVRVLRRFAGRDFPLEFSGEARERVLTLNAVLVPGVDSDPEDWRELGDLPGPHLWRDPDGRYVWVSITAPNLKRATGGASYRLSLTATEVDR